MVTISEEITGECCGNWIGLRNITTEMRQSAQRTNGQRRLICADNEVNFTSLGNYAPLRLIIIAYTK